MAEAYVPSRDPLSKIGRRLTQRRAARPVRLAFEEPLLSICFDDFPASAAEAGARVLEQHGARGTFYAAPGLAESEGPCGRNFTPAQARRLAAVGHEIGCHTFAHSDCAKRPVFETLHDLAKSRDAIEAMGCPSPRTLAYPFGETTFALKGALPPRLAAARGVLPGANIGHADLAQLRAYPMFGAGALSRLHGVLKRAARRKAWVIAFTHDISDTPSAWGNTARDLDSLLSAAHKLGFTVLPVSTALSRRIV